MLFSLPQHTLFYQLEKAIKRYRKLAQDRINATGYAITVNQLILLVNLSEHAGATQVELAEVLLKDFASVARMVDLLVQKGYLQRTENPIDRRKKDLVLTTSAQKMVEDLKPVILAYRQTALSDFTEDHRGQLSGLLERFTTNCEQGLAQEDSYVPTHSN